MTRPVWFGNTPVQTLGGAPKERRWGVPGLHDTRGATNGQLWGVERGPGDEYWGYDTGWFDSTKTHDDTGLQNPPRKKIPKKIFGGPTFFSRKKFFWFGGFLSSWVFRLKPNPCHRGFWSPWKPLSVIMGPPQTPHVTPIPSIRPTRSPHDTSPTPPRSPLGPLRSPWHPYCRHDTSGFTSGVLKTRSLKPGFGRLEDSRGTGKGSMTRGGALGGRSGGSNGGLGRETADMTRDGLIQPKPMMTRVCKPPLKKKSKKKISRSNFFFQEKNFSGLGGFCHHGFFI